jgi:hypothetical protein
MTNDNTQSSITQENIAALLVRLQELQKQVALVRDQIDPLEAKLTSVQKEFSTALNVTLQKIQLQKADIRHLRDQMESQNRNNFPPTHIGNRRVDPTKLVSPGRNAAKRRGLDEEVKNELSEHVVLILDDKQEELQAHINSLCSNPLLKLADVLEQVPWGAIWTTKNVAEALQDQYRRLASWEKALAERLEGLRHTFFQLQRDRRYMLWQEYQKGPIAWRDYLESLRQQYQAESEELAAELQGLYTNWAGLEKNYE